MGKRINVVMLSVYKCSNVHVGPLQLVITFSVKITYAYIYVYIV